MSALSRLLTLTACLLLGIWLAIAPGVAASEPPAQGFPHPAIWRVHNGTGTVYLFGSIHILPATLSWKSPEIDAAMRAANVFMFEVPIDAQALVAEKAFIIRNGLLPRGATLRAALSAQEYRTYSRILRDGGLNAQQFDRYRPWLAGIMLELVSLHRQDFTNLKGADDVLIGYAQAQGKQLRYFERVEQQLELLTRAEDAVQIKSLKELIASLPYARAHEEEVLDTWAKGDDSALARLIDGYFVGHPDARKLLIDDRNRAWLPRIKELLNTGSTAMVTVGAAHVGGETGLVRQLCAEGYEVERLGNEGGAPSRVCEPGA